MQAPTTVARFLSRGDGYRLFVEHIPPEAVGQRGALLFVHAFAEEMNKARHAVAQTARALAATGWYVASIDLLGCGDSSGDIADASWEHWLDDIAFAWSLVARERGTPPVLWGLRVGALAAVHAIPRLSHVPDLLFWQPVLSGRLYLTQFLRMKVAGQMFAEQGGGVTTQALRAELAAGRPVEIGGYMLRDALALSMERAELDPPAAFGGRLTWCEVASRSGDSTLPPGSASRQAKWVAAGARVMTVIVDDAPFWQTQEIAECPALTAATVRALGGDGA